MTSLTGVEIGRDSCVVIRARPLPGGDLAVSFAHRLEFPETAVDDGRLARALSELRRSAGLPRHLFAVSWTADSPQRVLARAGFDVKSVISPPQALALLAPMRAADTAGSGVAWLALNHQRAAFAIVCGPRLLFSRTFDWTVARAPLPASERGSLLRRYLYVSQLGPELQHAMKTVRERYGIRVGSAVTCGDMPDSAIAGHAAHRGAGHRGRNARYDRRVDDRGRSRWRLAARSGAGAAARVRGTGCAASGSRHGVATPDSPGRRGAQRVAARLRRVDIVERSNRRNASATSALSLECPSDGGICARVVRTDRSA